MRSGPPPRFVAAFLVRVRRRRTLLILLRVIGMVVAGLVSLLLLRGTLDSLLDFPRPLRLLLLCVDVCLVLAALWWWGFRPLREIRDARSTALLTERLEPRLRSAVISAVELQGRPEAADFLALLHARARQAISSFDLTALLPAREARRWLSGAAGLLGVAVLLAAVFPEPSRFIVLRHLGFEVPRPSRTRVVPVTRDVETVLGDRVVLSALAEGVIPRGGRVRVQREGEDGKMVDVRPSTKDPALFELPLENIQSSFSYQFLLNDGSGPEFAVTAAVPPRIASLTLRVSEPAYTRRPAEDLTEPPFRLLAGSTVEIRGEASEELTSARLQPGGDGAEIPLDVAGKTFSGRWTVPAEGFDGFTIPLMNTRGIPSRPDLFYAVRHMVDQPPSIDVIQPESLAESLVEGTPVDLVVLCRDDYPFDSPTLHFTIESPDAEERKGSLSLPASDPGQPTAVRWNPAMGAPTPKPGDRVTAWIEVRDAIGQSARTPDWTFRVVTKEEKRAELAERLRAQSLEIQRLREAQESAQEELRKSIEKKSP